MIYVNGEPREASSGLTVADVLAQMDLPDPQQRGIAVALDDEVVPRGEWASTTVPDEARVEVVHAVQGG